MIEGLDLLVSLVTLTAMEVVLGVDNIVFISVLVDKIPTHQQVKARRLGLILALLFRLGLLFTLSWIIGLTAPLFFLFEKAVSWRDIILLVAGFFLLIKATHEIYTHVEAPSEHHPSPQNAASAFGRVLIQVIIMDIVFSLDSVMTAVGMSANLWIMVTAMILSMLVMLAFSNSIAEMIHRHPSLKVLALAFLMLIGVLLVAEGMGTHVDKGYIYFAMAFSLGVEVVNIRWRRKRNP